MTFIEATTALLIMGALLGIVVPSFLGASVHSDDQTAQLNLRRAQAAAMILLVDHGTYAHAGAAGLAAVEPHLGYVDGSGQEASSGSGASDQIAVHVDGDGTVWAAAALSDSGTCWLIRDQVLYSKSPGAPGLRFGSAPDADQCDGEFAADSANTNGASW